MSRSSSRGRRGRRRARRSGRPFVAPGLRCLRGGRKASARLMRDCARLSSAVAFLSGRRAENGFGLQFCLLPSRAERRPPGVASATRLMEEMPPSEDLFAALGAGAELFDRINISSAKYGIIRLVRPAGFRSRRAGARRHGKSATADCRIPLLLSLARTAMRNGRCRDGKNLL